MCGENFIRYFQKSWKDGASPRARGKLAMGGKDGVDGRLIPACAGKTTSPAKSGPSRWAHPRVCGENLKHAGELMPFEGSSPRVRGKQPEWTAYYQREGLIPACAGKTRLSYSTAHHVWAHPRVCGENPFT